MKRTSRTNCEPRAFAAIRHSRRSSYNPVASVESLEDRRLLSGAGAGLVLAPPAGRIQAAVGTDWVTIALIHSANASAVAPTLTSTIDWDDGTPVLEAHGGFSVDSAHPNTIVLNVGHFFPTARVYHISVTVSNAGQSVGTLHEAVRIGAISPNGRTIHATAGKDFLADLGRINARGIDSTGLQISWGDGSVSGPAPRSGVALVGGLSNPIFVSGAGNAFVSSSHTYSTAGSYRVVASEGGQTLIVDRVVVRATRTPLSRKTLQTVSLPVPSHASVLGGLTANTAELTGIPASIPSVTTVIDFGDGTPPQKHDNRVMVSGVTAADFHQYQKPGDYVITSKFLNTATGARLGHVVRDRIKVTPTSDGGEQLHAMTGTQFQGVVATLVMSPAPTQIGIEWGDGSHSHGTLRRIGTNRYQVIGSHVYRDSGTFTVNVIGANGYDPFPPSPPPLLQSQLFQPALPITSIPSSGPGVGFTATVLSTMTVTGPSVPLVGPNVVATPLPVPDVNAQDTFDVTLATLSGYPTDPATAAQVYGRIDWGEGVVEDFNPNVPVTVENGMYVIKGTHEYATWDAAPKTYTLTMSFLLNTDDGTTPVLGKTQTTITVLPVNTPGGVTLNLHPGQIFSGSVGTTPILGIGADILVPNSIDWGDGTPPSSDITVTQQNGDFHVTASHTYAQPGAYRIIVSDVNSLGTNQMIMSRAVVGA